MDKQAVDAIIKSSDIAMLLAVLLGPILAIQVQKFIEKLEESKNRKLRIFRTLMATRATPLVNSRIEALNLIDIEFQDEAAVLEQWKICLDHLYDCPSNLESSTLSADLNIWNDRLKDKSARLLQAMAEALNYRFDEVQIKKGAYIPKAHVDLEEETYLLRKNLIDVMAGKRSISVRIKNE